MLVDLNAPYQTYNDKLSAAPEGAVAFSTGTQAWRYLTGIGLGLGSDVVAQTVEVAIITAIEPVYLSLVDSSYAMVGERQLVMPRGTAQLLTLPVVPSTYSLVVQAADNPHSARVILLGLFLRLA